MRMPPLIGTIVLTLLIAETAHGQKYPIRLSIPEHVGQKTQVSIMGSFNQEAASTKDGQVLKSVSMNNLVILEGRNEVLAVDSKGAAYRESFTVEKFTNMENGAITELLKPGSVILTDGSQEEANRIVLKDGVISDAARAALLKISAPHRPGSPRDDEIFGTKEQKGVGDRWTINKELAKNVFKEDLIIPIEKMTGVMSIESLGTYGGDECLNMISEINAD
ncbi:MAG TPA: hypothetical protein VFO86_05495, partial [Terriglobia bacterium]|nr:hypothetical protein [Terriglobia bacterium]